MNRRWIIMAVLDVMKNEIEMNGSIDIDASEMGEVSCVSQCAMSL